MRYKIREWIDPRTNVGAFEEGYDALIEPGDSKCDDRLRYLRDQPPQMWRDPHAKKLSWECDEDCKDIYEIRFKSNNLQQRPMGYFGPGSDEFTVVIWVTHKERHSVSNFCAKAKQRWADVRAGRVATKEVEID